MLVLTSGQCRAVPSPPVDEEFDTATVGGRIRFAYRNRPAGALSRNEFAARLGAHYPHVMRWEAGTQVPGGRYLGKIAELCGTTVDWLMRGGPEPFAAPSQTDPAPRTLYPAAFAAFERTAADLCAARGWLPPSPAELVEVAQARLGLHAGEEPTAEDFLDALELHRKIISRRRAPSLGAQAGAEAIAAGAKRRTPKRK